MVGTHCLDDRGAHEAGDDRNLWQGQRDYGQGHIVPVHPDIRIGFETANREVAGTKGKEQVHECLLYTSAADDALSFLTPCVCTDLTQTND